MPASNGGTPCAVKAACTVWGGGKAAKNTSSKAYLSPSRLMSQALRKLTGVIGKTKCIVIFINQIREKVGIMFGNPEVRSEASLF